MNNKKEKTERELINEIEDLYIEEIARLIKDGCTSGILDNENGITTVWELDINNFKRG